MIIIQWKEIERYTKKVVKLNLWKVKHLNYEFNDLLHDLYIVYIDCCKNIKTKGKQTFISYYKSSISNYIINLAKKDTEYYNNVIPINEDFFPYINNSEIDFKLKYTLASKRIKEVLGVINSKKYENLFKGKRGYRDNSKLCSILGYNKQKINLVQETISYFKD